MHPRIGSLVRLGPGSNLFYESSEDISSVILDDYEYALLLKVTSWCNGIEYEVLLGNYVMWLLNPEVSEIL